MIVKQKKTKLSFNFDLYKKKTQEFILPLFPRLENIYGIINTLSTCNPRNRVVILGISILEKLEQTVESNCLADELEKRDGHPTLLLPPGLQTLLFTFTMLWTCSVQKWSSFGRGKYFL